MSLLLDARKKSQQAQSAQGGNGSHSELELSPVEQPYSAASKPDSQVLENPRSAGRNLFNAKYPDSLPARTGVNRNLLIALGGTVVFLILGAGYVWYVISAGNNAPLRPINAPALASLSKPVPATTPPQINPVPETASPKIASPGILQSPSETAKPAHALRPTAKTRSPGTRDNMHIEQQSGAIDPLLNDAYLAYRSGKFDQAQQMYREALHLDARNTDALLGLAVIAQHRGADNDAAQYYSQVLLLDPRNAVANAGMAALTSDDNRESRLKNLLNEQQDSSSLHFALGNYYAAQARWGDAQQSYSNAYRLEPENAGLAFNLAVSFDRLGQKQSAAQYYQRALQIDQSHSAGFDHAQIEQRVQELVH